MGESLSRRERRKVEEQRAFYHNMKKNAAVLGTTLTAISAVAPLAPMVTVMADETDTTAEEANTNTIETTEQAPAEPVAIIEETVETQEIVEETTPATEIQEEVTTETLEIIEAESVEVVETPEVAPVEPEVPAPVQAPVQAAPFAAASSPMMRSSSAISSPATFISTVADYAVNIANANDLYASVMIAQAVIESGWGASSLSQAPNHNLFGIKGNYQGQTVYMSTLEYLNGQWVTKNEPFRKYPSFAESFADNAYTLKNVSLQYGVYYYAGAWKSNTKSYRDATAWLTGRYATDPSYASKLNNVIESYGLTRFDTPATGNPTTPSVPQTPNEPEIIDTSTNTGNSSSQTYTVKSGDSVWLIANKHGITMDQLRSWNNIKGDFIYPGQKLTVKKGSQVTPAPTPTPAPKPTAPVNPVKPTTPTNTNTNQKPATTNQTYTVKSGDSIWLIANNHGISMDSLRSLNNIKSDFIYPGQKLIIKKGSTTTATPTPVKPTTPTNTNTNQKPATANQTYTVKSGDSVWLIANKHGISMDSLRSLNSLKGDLIHPGQKLIIKKGSVTATPAPKPAPQLINTGGNTTNQTSKPATTNQTYTVKSGDSVWLIANKYGISMDSLRSLNNLKGDLIHPGQKLTIKKAAATSNVVLNTKTPAKPTNTVQNTAKNSHKVVSGDSLWALSQRYGVSVQKLKAANGLKSDTIYVGQALKV